MSVPLAERLLEVRERGVTRSTAGCYSGFRTHLLNLSLKSLSRARPRE